MKWGSGGGQFEKAPSGSHLARCYAVVDLGTQPQPDFQGEHRPPARMVRLSFELPNSKMAGTYREEDKGRPFAVHIHAKMSLHPKANLRKYMEGWRGKKFDDESVKAFDPRKLVGLPCRLALVENGDYVNVDSISPLNKDEVKKLPKVINEPVFFSLEPDEFSAVDFEKLSERTQEKIARSPEYVAATSGAAPGEEPQGDPPPDPGEGGSDDVGF